jgi:uncharacterized protein (TIGR02145 family)
MKNLTKLMGSGLLVLLSILHSCKKEEVPTLTTSEVTNITGTTATSGGTITDEGSGTILLRGICWSTTKTPTITDNTTSNGTGIGPFTGIMSGLNEATTYYVKAYATNEAGTGYGKAISFTTLGEAPTALTQFATNVTFTTATLLGTVNANYLSTTVTFEYGITTNYGNTIAAPQSPVTGNTSTDLSATISELNAGTTYYFRIKAVNSLGTTYGSDIKFSTLFETINDIDGNNYNTVKIGDQIWMHENLKTTKYNNSDLIGTTTPATLDISVESTPKYQWANGGNEANVSTYGRLYTWYAITDSRGVCPIGWHVPTDAEWLTLTNYLGGEDASYFKLKETGTSHWQSPNTGATNESGFSALPGGYRNYYGSFELIGSLFSLWFTTVSSDILAWSYDMGPEMYIQGLSPDYKHNGKCIRCIKD